MSASSRDSMPSSASTKRPALGRCWHCWFRGGDMSFEDVREQVAEANRVMAEFGLSSGAVAAHGHVSMRVPGSPDRFVVKGRGGRLRVAGGRRGGGRSG